MGATGFIFNFLLAAVLAVVIIGFILKKVLFSDAATNINRLHEERRKTERKQKELDIKAREYEERARAIIKEAEKNAEKIKNDAIESSEKQAKEIIAKGRAQGEELVKKANDAKDTLKKELEQKIEQAMIDTSVRAVKDVLNESMRKHLNDSISEGFIDDLKNADSSNIGDFDSAELTSCFEIPEKVKGEIKKILEDKVGHKIEIKESSDENLIGGVVLRFGTLMLDGSLIAKIKEAAERYKKESEK